MRAVSGETRKEDLDVVQSLGVGLCGGGKDSSIVLEIDDQGGKGLDLEKKPFPVIVQGRSVDGKEGFQGEIVEGALVFAGQGPGKDRPSNLGCSGQEDPVRHTPYRFLGRCDLVENLGKFGLDLGVSGDLAEILSRNEEFCFGHAESFIS
ncbi:MAG: hypothetical protein D084_Lepto4C00179G0002 [Leptospirillum sp. Group IV 'UBA BS']|nr:MAG: hypothetical protein D084_Lepto4C00179G0002 [Leptospirillum sp. Group IV 'UBA BS']